MTVETVHPTRAAVLEMHKRAIGDFFNNPKSPIQRLRTELRSDSLPASQEERNKGLGFVEQAQCRLDRLKEIAFETSDEQVFDSACKMQRLLADLNKMDAADAIAAGAENSLFAFMLARLKPFSPETLKNTNETRDFSEKLMNMKKLRDFSAHFLEDGQEFIVREAPAQQPDEQGFVASGVPAREFEILLPFATPSIIEKIGSMKAWDEKLPPRWHIGETPMSAVTYYEFASSALEPSVAHHLEVELWLKCNQMRKTEAGIVTHIANFAEIPLQETEQWLSEHSGVYGYRLDLSKIQASPGLLSAATAQFTLVSEMFLSFGTPDGQVRYLHLPDKS